MKKLKILTVVGAAAMLSSCDLSQIPGVSGKLSIEDSKAVGAACRHSGRALEDCFTLNPNTLQSGVFEGWREMNDYMIANKLEVVKPEIRTSSFPAEKSAAEAAAEEPHGHGDKTKPGAEKAEAAAPASGRQRWVPKGSGSSTADPLPQAHAAPGNAPADAKSPSGTYKDGAQARDESPVEPPARPWERKKDPKKHT